MDNDSLLVDTDCHLSKDYQVLTVVHVRYQFLPKLVLLYFPLTAFFFFVELGHHVECFHPQQAN